MWLGPRGRRLTCACLWMYVLGLVSEQAKIIAANRNIYLIFQNMCTCEYLTMAFMYVHFPSSACSAWFIVALKWSIYKHCVSVKILF